MVGWWSSRDAEALWPVGWPLLVHHASRQALVSDARSRRTRVGQEALFRMVHHKGNGSSGGRVHQGEWLMTGRMVHQKGNAHQKENGSSNGEWLITTLSCSGRRPGIDSDQRINLALHLVDDC